MPLGILGVPSGRPFHMTPFFSRQERTNVRTGAAFHLCCIALTASSARDGADKHQTIIHDADAFDPGGAARRALGEGRRADHGATGKIRQANGNRPPNIVYILLDDVGFGELGMPDLDVIRGYDTPRISQLAREGLTYSRMYTEPSCTPTRAAMMTGRYAVRTGFNEAKSVVEGEGLAAWEVTLPEVLSQSGYATVHIGKWHLGDIEESYAFNQGFDYAEHPLHQQGQMAIMNAHRGAGRPDDRPIQKTAGRHVRTRQDLPHETQCHVYGIVGRKGGMAREVNSSPARSSPRNITTVWRRVIRIAF